jgi:hypothetical protein
LGLLSCSAGTTVNVGDQTPGIPSKEISSGVIAVGQTKLFDFNPNVSNFWAVCAARPVVGADANVYPYRPGATCPKDGLGEFSAMAYPELAGTGWHLTKNRGIWAK